VYLSNGSSFPKPLTAAEEQYYLDKYKAGDESARDILIERNLRLVAHVIKKYYVEVEKEILDDEINLFCNGLEIRDGKDELYITKNAKLELITNKTCYVYISEGKFHQIKRMFEKINNKVLYLKRVKFGDIELDPSLQLGEYRELTEEEIILFKQGK